MDATVTIEVYPEYAVPSEGRVEWLEAHGAPPSSAEVSVTAPLAQWEAAGIGIAANGGLEWYGREKDGVADTIRGAITRRIRATGEVPVEFDATDVLAGLAREREKALRAAAIEAERKEAEERAAKALHRQRAEEQLAVMRAGGDDAIEAWRRLDSPKMWWNNLTDSEKAEVTAWGEAYEVAKKAAQERAKDEIRAFAADGLAGPAAQRAAKEGYDVIGAVLDSVAAQQLPAPHARSVPDDDYEWEERPSPNEDAFALLDRIAQAVAAATVRPACVNVDCSRIMRITEPEGEEEHGRKRTGVVVTISSPITPNRYLLYYVE